MAYELDWIDGPAAGDSQDEYDRRAHLRISESLMGALYREMERQGMIGHEAGRGLVGDWEVKLEQGGQVTREELVVALAPATDAPAPMNPPLMGDAEWRERWQEWLDFLVGAMNHGGFSVTR